jgi:acetyl esterase/lipase
MARNRKRESPMSNAEIDIIRAQLAASPRPTDMAGRRARLNALGSHYKLPADVRVEPARPNGVAAEWTATPKADISHVLMFLLGGGYVSGSLESHSIGDGNRSPCQTPFKTSLSAYRVNTLNVFEASEGSGETPSPLAPRYAT